MYNNTVFGIVVDDTQTTPSYIVLRLIVTNFFID